MRRRDAGQAVVAAGPVLQGRQREIVEHLGEGERQDGEVDAVAAQGEIAEKRRYQRGDHDRDDKGGDDVRRDVPEREAGAVGRAAPERSEESRVGTEWVSTCRYRWLQRH